MNESNLTPVWRVATGLLVAVALAIELFLPRAAHAQPLPELVFQAWANDPSMAEVQANRDAATAKSQGSRALHMPRFGVTTAQPLSGPNSQRGKPELTGSFNLWAGGSIEAQAKADEREVQYFAAKQAEARNELAMKVSTLYLDALRQQEQIAVTQTNLGRHEKILGDLTVIAKYDQGRQADVLQAQARTAQVKARILGLQSELLGSMSRLSKYSSQPQTALQAFAIDTQTLAHRLAQPSFESNAPYVAQMQEVARLAHLVDVAKGQRQPRLELEARQGERLVSQLRLNWDFYDQSGGANVQAARQRVTAAQAKLDGLVNDLVERRRTAAVDMAQAQLRFEAAQGQIESARRVTQAYEKQFQIARRTLVDVLNAYAELATVEAGLAQAEQEARLAALRAVVANDTLEEFLRALPRPDKPTATPTDTPSDAPTEARSAKSTSSGTDLTLAANEDLAAPAY